MDYSPMRVGQEEIFTVNFAPLLAPSETLNTPVWTITAVDAIDPNAAAMIQGAATIAGPLVSQMINTKTAGVPGTRYAPKCTVKTSLGQTLVLPEYGQGQLEVTL